MLGAEFSKKAIEKRNAEKKELERIRQQQMDLAALA